MRTQENLSQCTQPFQTWTIRNKTNGPMASDTSLLPTRLNSCQSKPFLHGISTHPAFSQLQPNLTICIFLHQRWGVLTKGEEDWQVSNKENTMLPDWTQDMLEREEDATGGKEGSLVIIAQVGFFSPAVLNKVFWWLQSLVNTFLVLAHMLHCCQVWIRHRIMKVRSEVHLTPCLEVRCDSKDRGLDPFVRSEEVQWKRYAF